MKLIIINYVINQFLLYFIMPKGKHISVRPNLNPQMPLTFICICFNLHLAVHDFYNILIFVLFKETGKTQKQKQWN